MTINYIYNGQPMTGDEDDEFFIAYQGSTGTNANTVNAAGGNDWVMGDSSDTWLPSAGYNNDSIADAFNLEAITSTWTTDENPLFGSSATPHTTAIVEATIGQSEFFRVDIAAGQTITIDIDFAFGSPFGSRDLLVELQDAGGNVLRSGDDSSISQGGLGSFPNSPGSTGSYDPYLTYTAAAAGSYYINVRPFGGGPGSTFTANDIFLLNVSVGGHATGAASVMGADTINGGTGDDTLFGQGGADTINGDAGNDLIHGGSAVDTIHGGDDNDTIYGGEGTEEDAHGDDGDDTLYSGGEGHYYGDGGNDIIYAGLTSGVNEILDGGAGVDTIDTTSWNSSYSIDLITGSTSFGESFTNFENATTGGGNDIIIGTAEDNLIRTQGGSDTVSAGGGDDTVEGGTGGDSLNGDGGIDTISYRTSVSGVTVSLVASTATGGDATDDTIAGFENAIGSNANDSLTGNGGDNVLIANAGVDTLVGNNGNDTLNGGFGADDMTGGLGNDIYYIDNVGDVFHENVGEGTDTIAAGYSYSIASTLEIERLMTIDAAATNVINLTGNSLNNIITGNAGSNNLDGGSGNDQLLGGGGMDVLIGGTGADSMAGGFDDDSYSVENAGDTVIEAAGQGYDTVNSSITFSLGGQNAERLFLTGASAINGTGNGLDNVIFGNGAANTLTGGGGDDSLHGNAGADTMIGGLGDDSYHVDNAGDVVTENSGEGTDAVDATIDYTLGANLENLNLINAAIKGIGNTLANTIAGNSNDNFLYGGAGVDTLIGGAGNDNFFVENVGDVVTEEMGDGTDTVNSSVTFTLDVHIERLILTGAASTNGTGNSLNNTITGNGGNNILDGGLGADNMKGGGGDDTYIVDHVGDKTEEAGGGGNDSVYASVDYSVATTNVESLVLTGTAVKATGNGLNNTLTGNASNNILIGGSGADTMAAGLGNDIYYVDNAGDVVTEFGGGGIDTVRSAINYTIGATLENLTLVGTAIFATGNAGANTMLGNASNNVIDGAAGGDTMKGGAGDDTYKIDNAGDTIVELTGEGTDTVETFVSFATGGQFIEIVKLMGGGNINATGNGYANTLLGNSGANVLNAGAGDDELHGGGGTDTLAGGTGSDAFWFETALGAGNVDTINDFASVDDIIHLDRTIFSGIGANGTLAAGAFATGTAAADAGDRIIYDQATGRIYYDSDGTGAAAAVLFAQVTAGTVMLASDFFADP